MMGAALKGIKHYMQKENYPVQTYISLINFGPLNDSGAPQCCLGPTTLGVLESGLFDVFHAREAGSLLIRTSRATLLHATPPESQGIVAHWGKVLLVATSHTYLEFCLDRGKGLLAAAELRLRVAAQHARSITDAKRRRT